MGVASYFDRDIKALNSRVSQQTEDQFKHILNKHIICIQIDKQVLESNEASVFVELLVRIISRFYPKIMFISSCTEVDKEIKHFKKLAKSINSNIEFGHKSDIATYTVVVDRKYKLPTGKKGIYAGSEGWTAKVSESKYQSFGKSNNPFGAGIAGCIVASNIFRYVFYNQLGIKGDSEVNLSILSSMLRPNNQMKSLPDNLTNIKLNNVDLVGIGAIGNATVWALSKLDKLSGNINLIDSEPIEESNLQRYILFGEKDVNKTKVELAKNQLKKTGLTINPYKETWGEYINIRHAGKCNTRLVAVSVDSKIDRVYVQSSLPKKIINAYTDEDRFGITRHFDFNKEVCLSCIYVPFNVEKSKLQKMIEGIGLNFNDQNHINFTFHYMKETNLIDDKFLNIFCKENNLLIDEYERYRGRTLGELYTDIVCGVKAIEFNKANRQAENMDVPLSFQSCMAGIILAAEIIIESISKEDESVFTSTSFEVLKPISNQNPNHVNRLKNENGNCMCGDIDYQTIYKEKWT